MSQDQSRTDLTDIEPARAGAGTALRYLAGLFGFAAILYLTVLPLLPIGFAIAQVNFFPVLTWGRWRQETLRHFAHDSLTCYVPF